MSRAAAALVAAGVALALPASALAHASLKHSEPVTQSRVEVSPREVVLRFDQSVSILPNAIQVFGADGRLVSGAAHQEAANRVVSAPSTSASSRSSSGRKMRCSCRSWTSSTAISPRSRPRRGSASPSS
jgi:methionine-rich copper-binding protein CopC